MKSILTITLNPSVDLATSAKKIRPGHKIRCKAPLRDPGGGGINVARAIHLLGGEVNAFAAVAGHMGQTLLGLLNSEGVQVHAFDIPGETRQSLAVTGRKTGGQYRFVMPGPKWDAARVDEVLISIQEVTPQGGYVVLSGSNPPGVSADFPARLARAIAPTGARLVVDTSGAALRQIMQQPDAPPYLLRMNDSEAEELAHKPLKTVAELAEFAFELVAKNVAEVIVLALGATGSVLVKKGAGWHCVAPDVPVRSKVGAGDSFVGAMVLSLARGEAAELALQKGVAAASAAVMTDATRLCERRQAEALLKDCELKRLVK